MAKVLWMIMFGGLTACTFNFDVTSQRTALENQVMGAYKELDDDLILVSSVRGVQKADAKAESLAPSKRRALDARLNQQFNRDDIEELKSLQILGESADGTLAIVPKRRPEASLPGDLRLAQTLLVEENRDRRRIWQRIIDGNENLTDSDLPNVQKTYAKMQRDSGLPGTWYQEVNGSWERKPLAGEGRL